MDRRRLLLNELAILHSSVFTRRAEGFNYSEPRAAQSVIDPRNRQLQWKRKTQPPQDRQDQWQVPALATAEPRTRDLEAMNNLAGALNVRGHCRGLGEWSPKTFGRLRRPPAAGSSRPRGDVRGLGGNGR